MLGKPLRVGMQVRVLLGLLVIALLVSVAACGRQDATPASPSVDEQLSADNLLIDIELLDTINRLELTAPQLDELVEIVMHLEDIGNTYNQRAAQIKRQLQPILAQKRDLLVKDQPPSEDLQDKLYQGQQRLQQLGTERTEALRQLIPNLREVLTASQVQITAGADEAKAQAEEMLAWLREMPEVEYREEGPANAEALAAPEIGLGPEVLLDIFGTARNTPAGQYRQAKEELAARIAPIYGATPAAADRQMLRLFTNPRIRIILEQKAAIARH